MVEALGFVLDLTLHVVLDCAGADDKSGGDVASARVLARDGLTLSSFRFALLPWFG